MSNIETIYTDACAWFEAQLELCSDPEEREALASAICTCHERIAAERARQAARQGVPA